MQTPLFSYMRFYVDFVYDDVRGREENKEFECVCVRFISFLFIFSLFNLLLGCFLFLPSSSSSFAFFPFYHSTQKLLPLVILIRALCCVFGAVIVVTMFEKKFSLCFLGLDSIFGIHFAYQAIIYCGSLHSCLRPFLFISLALSSY